MGPLEMHEHDSYHEKGTGQRLSINPIAPVWYSCLLWFHKGIGQAHERLSEAREHTVLGVLVLGGATINGYLPRR